MLRSKKDVDKHVRSMLAKLREDEKNTRGYRISGLYFNIGEYSSALEYIQKYISSNNRNAAAYKVLGQCYEKLKRPDKQLQAYQRSLELDKKQTDLLVEVCKLLQSNELSDVTPAKARFWYELAESRNVTDPAVLNLKLKFMDNGDVAGMQDIILKEIFRRPLDIGLHTQLVYHYLGQSRVDDAFKYVTDNELKPNNNKFRNSSDWCKTVMRVLEAYKEKHLASIQKNWPYWLQLIITIERQLFLALLDSSEHSQADATNLLFELDSNLGKVAKICKIPEADRELSSEFLVFYRGQFCLHAASLLFKRHTDSPNWLGTTKSALPLLLFAYNFGTIESNQMWLKNASETSKQLIELWKVQSSFRVAQAARTLHSCVSTNNTSDNAVLANFRKICMDKYSGWSNADDVLNEIRSIVADSDWRKKTYRQLFRTNEQQNAMGESCFVKTTAFEQPNFSWPDTSRLAVHELKSQQADPSNLGILVYLAMNSDCRSGAKPNEVTIDPAFKCVLFPNLKFTATNLVTCSAETLNQLDIDTFIYATTLQAKRNVMMGNTMLNGAQPETNKPKILPFANMASTLSTDEQKDWWTAAYKVYQNIAGEELAEARATLQYGIEAVRGVGSPKMDLIMLLKLGQIFSQKTQRSTKPIERTCFEDRSEALFKLALHVWRMKNNSRSKSEPFRRFFKYSTGSNFFEIEQEVNNLTEEAITYLAGRYFNKNAFEECIEELEGIKLPFATYFLAESYRKLTENGETPKKNKRAYLDKAKDYLKRTLDLLENPNVDKNHPLRAIIDEDIKRLHNDTRRFDTNQSMSDSFVSANGRSDLEETVDRYDREAETATPVPHNANENIERMMRQMMESLNILSDRVQNIEERLMKNESDALNESEEFFFNERLKNQNLNNTSMMGNVSRNQTLNAQTPTKGHLREAAQGFPHQSPLAMNNPYMNPLLYAQLSMNPYHAALMNAAGQNFNQSPQLAANYNMQMAYNMADPHNANLLGFMAPPTTQPMAQQPYGMTSPMMMKPALQSTPAAPISQQAPPITAQPAVNQPITQSPVQKQWNPSINNAPVEKGTPQVVVITSSDPVPHNTSSITTQATPHFSVTIPAQHMKNNPPALGAAFANPSIVAALQNNNPAQPTAKPVETKPFTSTATVPTTQEQKSIFASLMKPKPVSSTPFASPSVNQSPATKAEPPKAEPTKPNAFANFSFGLQTSSASSEATTATPPKPFFSFSNIGQSVNKSDASLAYAATPETPSQSDAAANTSSNSAKDDDDNYEPTAHFEPVIPLPDLVEVKTGEENEEVLFEHRAKLLRYVKESKEWKDRGIGNMKVMANKDDPNKLRLVMRREQVLKLCCNQLIEKDTKFNKLPKSETALSWFGHDYSENELQLEMLAIRFKEAAVCKQFHDAIVTAQAKMTDGKAPTVAAADTSSKPSTAAPAKGFGDQFKPKAGSWSCDACYVQNQAANVKCLSCGTPNKNAPADVSTSTQPAAAAPKFSFGNLTANSAPVQKPAEAKPATKSLADQFKPKPGSWSCKACYTSNTADAVHCACCEEPKDDTIPKKEKQNVFSSSGGAPNFNFGNLGASQSTTATTSTPVAFGTSNFSFSFGSQAPSVTSITPAITTPQGDSKEFGFVFKGKSPMKQPPPVIDGVEDVSDDENVEEEENNTYFAPVIPLPDKIEVKTGEEEESVLYSHRAKLFRFREKEWRERGLGDVKILKHKQTGQLRVVMRREQIHKICLNHSLTADIAYKVKDAKSWNFTVNDFSEGTFEADSFCLRFKTEEIAGDFKKAIDGALSGALTNGNGNATDQSDSSNTSSEERANIITMQMGSDFYNYKTVEPCPGCCGCSSDDFKLPEVKNTNFSQFDDNPLPLHPPPPVDFSRNDLSKNTKKTINPFSMAPKEDAKNSFSFISNTSASDSPPTGMFFGTNSFKTSFTAGNTSNDSSTTAFGQTSLFGGNVTKQASAEAVRPAFSFNSTSVFGNKSATDEKSPFSFTPTSKPQDNATDSLFGSKTSFGSGGGNKTPTTNLFGGNVNGATVTTPSNFSFKLPDSTTVTPITAKDASSIQTPNQSEEQTGTSIFGSGSSFSFADLAKNSAESDNDNVPFKNIGNGFSFAALAQNNSNGTPAFKSPSGGEFIGLTNGDTFNNLMKPKPVANDDGENVAEDPNYDPHYEPIIALPDEIQVSTGEESETKLFGERAKLYRYDSDNKEWKERGVGEFKILHHPENGSYRLLLRREQIHKLVLNMALSADLQINPMKQNDKAFLWVAQNFAEEQENGELESLSVRFKNAKLASNFHETVQECIEKLKARSSN